MILTFVGNLFCCIYLLVSFPWNIFAVKIIESVGNLWYRVSIWRYQLVTAGTGSEYYDAGCHLVEKGPYRLLLGGTGLEQGGTGYFVMALSRYRALMPLYNEVEGVVGCHLFRTDFEM